MAHLSNQIMKFLFGESFYFLIVYDTTVLYPTEDLAALARAKAAVVPMYPQTPPNPYLPPEQQVHQSSDTRGYFGQPNQQAYHLPHQQAPTSQHVPCQQYPQQCPGYSQGSVGASISYQSGLAATSMHVGAPVTQGAPNPVASYQPSDDPPPYDASYSNQGK